MVSLIHPWTHSEWKSYDHDVDSKGSMLQGWISQPDSSVTVWSGDSGSSHDAELPRCRVQRCGGIKPATDQTDTRYLAFRQAIRSSNQSFVTGVEETPSTKNIIAGGMDFERRHVQVANIAVDMVSRTWIPYKRSAEKRGCVEHCPSKTLACQALVKQ